MIIDYELAKGYDSYSLNATVKSMMTQGWQPFGSMSTNADINLTDHYFQPMVKHD